MSQLPVTSDELVKITDEPAAPQRRNFEYHAIFLALSTVVLILAATMATDGSSVTPPLISRPLPELCNSRRFLGIDCPGCGMTRCFISLAHGDVRAAWEYNAGGILLFGLFVAQIPYRSAQMWRLSRGQAEWRPGRLMGWFAGLLITILMLQWFWKLYLFATTLSG